MLNQHFLDPAVCQAPGRAPGYKDKMGCLVPPRPKRWLEREGQETKMALGLGDQRQARANAKAAAGLPEL